MIRVIFRPLRPILAVVAMGFVASAVGCGGGGGGSSAPPVQTPVSVSLGISTVVVPQDGTPVLAPITITSSSETALVSFTGLPGGIQQKYTSTNTNPSGTLTFIGGATSQPGTYTPTVTVNTAGQAASTSFILIVAVVAKVGNTTDTTMGVKGVLKQFMSTSFQIAEWSGNLFGTGATATARENSLTVLGPRHIRLQALSQAIPMKANTGTASDWDFTLLDQTVQPVLASADRSPEFQIAVAPAWMCYSNGNFNITDHLKDFAAYAANLVRYYNKGGFSMGGKVFQSPSSQPITWWGVFNEFNLTGLTISQYVQLYNAVVPAMLVVDPTIKFSALELSDFGLGTGQAGDPQLYMPSFVAPANAGGVSAQVDIVSAHLYGSCNEMDPDAALFNAVPPFAANVSYIYQELAARADLANVPVWVTENNVNADFTAANGMSSCNPTQTFVADQRGTSAFFAAWRPYVFSKLGKAGNQALFQWTFAGDKQYGEVDANGSPYLSYWVDKALQNFYPSTGTKILALTSTDNSSIETLATQNSDGTVIVMLVDRAVRASGDNNGIGDPRTVIVDLSSFGSFYAASLLSINSTTNLTTGPSGVGVTPSSRMTVTLPGYGVAFLQLTP